jgi:hypothetical protein
MKLSTYAILVAILSLVFGLEFLFIPVKIAAFYGGKVDDGNILIARMLGTTFCFLGLIFWSFRKIPVTDPIWSKLLLLSLIYDVVQLVLSIMAQLNGLMNAMGWTVIGTYVLLCIGSAYYLAQNKKPAATAA